MTTVVRLTRYTAAGFLGGALAVITAGLVYAVADWQHINRITK